MHDEMENLNKIADSDQGYDRGINALMINYTSELFKKKMLKTWGGVLELGPAQGIMTKLLSLYYSDYTVVDASSSFINQIKKNLPSVKTYNCLFEEFEPDKVYDNILLSHVLEHVENPVYILKLCRRWVSNNGRILAAVPNKNSLHRQIGVNLGLMDSVDRLHSGDIKIGHRRVYDMETLITDFASSGLQVIETGGYWLKPLSNQQIEASWSDELINAYMKMGEKYPEIAANIYVVAQKNNLDDIGR